MWAMKERTDDGDGAAWSEKRAERKVPRNERYKCRKFETETMTERGNLSFKEVIRAVNEEMPV